MTDDNIPSNPAASDDAKPVKPLAKNAESVSSAAANKKPVSTAKTRSKAAPKDQDNTAVTTPDGEQASKPAVKKPAAKKPAAGKSVAKPAVKPAVKKAPSEKTPTTKTTTAKTAVKKPVANKSTVKPASSKPAATKKAPVKKSASKSTTTDTTIAARATNSSDKPALMAVPQPEITSRADAPVANGIVLSSTSKPAGKKASAGFNKEFLLDRTRVYWRLARMDKPIGALLLLWPTLWALWLAAEGFPRWDLLVIFVLGVFVMRAAGCVINDFADRKVDGHVKRTQGRPLATGEASSREAVGVFIALCLVAFGLVLLTDKFTIYLSFGGLLLAFCYPFMKRHTHLPQVVLGAAFAWGIPMAFAAQSGAVGPGAWLLYTTVVLWTVVYDTFYAMVDRDDDLRIGVKSTAILFGEQDRVITATLQAMTVYALILVGSRFELGGFYYAGVTLAAALFVYQQYLIRFRVRNDCFKAFMNNNWVGAAVFIGIVLNYWLS